MLERRVGLLLLGGQGALSSVVFTLWMYKRGIIHFPPDKVLPTMNMSPFICTNVTQKVHKVQSS